MHLLASVIEAWGLLKHVCQGSPYTARIAVYSLKKGGCAVVARFLGVCTAKVLLQD